MAEDKAHLTAILDELARIRDELALKLHLGKAEAKQEWEKLERRWSELRAEARPFEEAAGQTARNVGSALELAAEELKEGYKRFRKLL